MYVCVCTYKGTNIHIYFAYARINRIDRKVMNNSIQTLLINIHSESRCIRTCNIGPPTSKNTEYFYK